MICCAHSDRKKHGKDRNGNQRWKCCLCGATFASNERRPLGDMRISMDKAVQVLGLLLEGMSIRACERLTGVKRDTICDLVLLVGQNCDRFMRETIKDVPAKTIELDEIWSFVAMKAKTKEQLGHTGDVGDSWTWLAIDADTKMVLAHTVGLRNESTCEEFLGRLNKATSGRCQVTSDGLRLYTYGVPFAMGPRADFAQLVKEYAATPSTVRYSPASIIGIEKIVRVGQPDEEKISTSYAERLNLSVRMHCRRLTRLTNGHSKSAVHHEAAIAMFVCWYNFCRTNSALGRKTTPAMAAGLADRIWDIEEMLCQSVA
jgi:transposase-like protein/IS1 family transposase